VSAAKDRQQVETDSLSDEDSGCRGMPTGSTILVVDDEAEIVDDIVEHLGHLGYATCSASSGAEALARILEDPRIRVCLTDLRMPEMDGIALLNEARIRDERRFAQMHWIMLTGHATPADERAALAAGAGIFIRKPCSLSEISAAVARAFAMASIGRRGAECRNPGPVDVACISLKHNHAGGTNQ
jgi:CheY-like chemotaxis protein